MAQFPPGNKPSVSEAMMAKFTDVYKSTNTIT